MTALVLAVALPVALVAYLVWQAHPLRAARRSRAEQEAADRACREWKARR